MGYEANTFTPFEQPTTEKWNKLWANDAAFNDGSGIGNGAILPKHLAVGLSEGILINGKIVVSVASNDLTVAIKTLAGNDPSASDPVKIVINGSLRTITAALSVTANDATNHLNLGATYLATLPHPLFVYLAVHSSSLYLGFSRVPYAKTYADVNAGGTNELGSIWSTTPDNADVVANIGIFNATLSAGAGYTWSLPVSGAYVVSRPTYSSPWTDFALVETGWSGTPTTTLKYKVTDEDFYVRIQVNGTADATSKQVTVPFNSADFKSGTGYTPLDGDFWGSYQIQPAAKVVSWAQITTVDGNANSRIQLTEGSGSGTEIVYCNDFFPLR